MWTTCKNIVWMFQSSRGIQKSFMIQIPHPPRRKDHDSCWPRDHSAHGQQTCSVILGRTKNCSCLQLSLGRWGYMSGRPKDIPQVSGDTRDSSETAIGLFHFTYTNRHSHSQLSGTLDARNSFVKMTGCRWDISVKPGWLIGMDFNIFDEVDNFGWRESPFLVRFIFNIYKIMRIDHCHIDVINFFLCGTAIFFQIQFCPLLRSWIDVALWHTLAIGWRQPWNRAGLILQWKLSFCFRHSRPWSLY